MEGYSYIVKLSLGLWDLDVFCQSALQPFAWGAVFYRTPNATLRSCQFLYHFGPRWISLQQLRPLHTVLFFFQPKLTRKKKDIWSHVTSIMFAHLDWTSAIIFWNKLDFFCIFCIRLDCFQGCLTNQRRRRLLAVSLFDIFRHIFCHFSLWLGLVYVCVSLYVSCSERRTIKWSLLLDFHFSQTLIFTLNGYKNEQIGLSVQGVFAQVFFYIKDPKNPSKNNGLSV